MGGTGHDDARTTRAGHMPDEMYAFLKQFIDIIVWAAKDDRGYKVPRVWLKGVSEQRRAQS